MAITHRATQVTQSSSTQGLTATMPSGVQNGDVIVVWIVCDSTVATFTAPGAGWTQLSAPDGYSSAPSKLTAAYYHVVTDAGNIPTCAFSTTSALGRATMIATAYDGVDNSNPIDAAAVVTATVSTQNFVTLTGVTTVTDGALLVSCAAGGWSSDGWAAPSGALTTRGTHTSATGRSAALADETIATAGATGTRTHTRATATGSELQGMQCALKPDAGGGQTHPNRNYIWRP